MTLAVSLLSLAAGLLLLVGAASLLLFPDVLCRSHGLTAAATLGLALLLAAAAVHLKTDVLRAGFAVLLQFLTIPVAGHLIALLAYRRDVRRWKKGPVR